MLCSPSVFHAEFQSQYVKAQVIRAPYIYWWHYKIRQNTCYKLHHQWADHTPPAFFHVDSKPALRPPFRACHYFRYLIFAASKMSMTLALWFDTRHYMHIIDAEALLRSACHRTAIMPLFTLYRLNASIICTATVIVVADSTPIQMRYAPSISEAFSRLGICRYLSSKRSKEVVS